MPTGCVIYFSGSGHTTKEAEAVAKAAASLAGVKTNFIALSGDTIRRRNASATPRGSGKESPDDKAGAGRRRQNTRAFQTLWNAS